jgi:hypothetical protein
MRPTRGPLFLAAASILITGFTAATAAAKRRPAVCAPGRFLVAAADRPLLGGAATIDSEWVVISSDRRLSLANCQPSIAKLKARRRLTSVRVASIRCGAAGTFRLRASIAQPGCDTLRGFLKRRRMRKKPFTAQRSRCGDGTIDPANGETCEPPATASCDAQCHDLASTTSTIATSTSTTTLNPLVPPHAVAGELRTVTTYRVPEEERQGVLALADQIAGLGVPLTLHNNGCFGSTLVVQTLHNNNLGGRLLGASGNPIGKELEHFTTGALREPYETFVYQARQAVTYVPPDQCPDRNAFDVYQFSADGRFVTVTFRFVMSRF